ncbi:hypothetical protein IOK49_04700 [Fervidicoccus fontis]|uniref:Uncharacterized protein n=2 Tax=Fervidicoccus fontis TaxID=683846 RepID=I0A267_FERFK|nr:hypothetical protein [Fervidicoccus fontis]AFH43074.1 hypothetical protein FFONT_1086 [Fervidicoccus fontis Kam940]MBE9391372.1 hypothetical protein [Fervidicoccus fontis]PMB75607.1 MAG: hypothetical protein C0188_02495 [Fervidicoccus fontis]HEW64104.1 hypothetical protein [Fervidicoccus fontis]
MLLLSIVSSKDYYLFVKNLREESIDFKSPSYLPFKCSEDDVVICDKKGCKEIIGTCRKFKIEKFTDEVFLSLIPFMIDGKEKYKEIIVGIDVGREIGYVVLADGKIIGKGKVIQDEIISVLKKYENVPHDNMIVKIGDYNDNNRLWNLTSTILENVSAELELVDEYKTSKIKRKQLEEKDPDVKAAYIIANRSGTIKLRKHGKNT